LLRQGGQLLFQLRNACFKQADFLDQQCHRVTYQRRHSRVRIGQHPTNLFNAVAAASRNGNAELPAKAAQSIDAGSTSAHPQRTDAMQTLQRLLLDRLDLDRRDIGATGCFDQGTCIGGIGLVAFDVGADIRSRQELDIDAHGVKLARPVVRRAARFHDDERDIAVDEPALELAAREAVLLDDAPRGIGHGKLEDAFCQIHSYSSRLHVGLPSLIIADTHPMRPAGTMMPLKNGGVHPIIQTDAASRRGLIQTLNIMTVDEYSQEVESVLQGHTQAAASRFSAALKLIPPEAEELVINIHVDQGGEGFLGIRLNLVGQNLYVLNKAIEAYAQLFDTKMTDAGLEPPLPLMDPFEEEFSVNDVLTDLAVTWIRGIWKKVDRNGFELPVTVVSAEGYGSEAPTKLK
jgi:hypothetical protein